MIIFEGTKTVGLQKFLIFKNENNSKVEIPLNNNYVDLILFYLESLKK